jgi:hypothetical protein
MIVSVSSVVDPGRVEPGATENPEVSVQASFQGKNAPAKDR